MTRNGSMNRELFKKFPREKFLLISKMSLKADLKVLSNFRNLQQTQIHLIKHLNKYEKKKVKNRVTEIKYPATKME